MKIVPALVLAAAMAVLGACNTVSGAGQDIESGGRAISNTAEDAKQEMSQ